MPEIKLLPKNIAELIAAGEVVERPASVIKELIENSVDAMATKIVIEIKNGGISLIRITDNGCGIAKNDVKTAFLRHATSKIKNENDLQKISTLGFRGEALASVQAVARVEMITRDKNEEVGTHYIIEGGEEKVIEDIGCETGTTVIVRDLFFNTPARMKFLRKDVAEGNAVAGVVERMALSHPEISFKFIREGKSVLSTIGDGNLKNTVYSVLGREFSASVIPVDYELERVKVTGFVCKPVYCRPSRSGQYFFLNGRMIKSLTAVSAIERAYKNSVMVGKFPSCVININVPSDTVDVNVHPAKTEVRFSNEQLISNAVYFAVKNAIESLDTRPVISIKTPKFSSFEHMSAETYRQEVLKEMPKKEYEEERYFPIKRQDVTVEFNEANTDEKKVFSPPAAPESDTQIIKEKDLPKTDIIEKTETEDKSDNDLSDDGIKLIGEAFATYIIVQKGDSIFFIDKHASHERILFEKLKKTEKNSAQALLIPVNVKLGVKEYNAVLGNLEVLGKSGFEIEDFGNGTVIVRAVPSALLKEDIAFIVSEAASSLSQTGNADISELDGIYHTVACKAAIKAGYATTKEEMLYLAKLVLKDNSIMYCPHGRPVAFEVSRHDLEKQFGRIQ